MVALAEGDVAVGFARHVEALGVAKCAGSRLAAPMPMVIGVPAGSVVPPSAIGASSLRLLSWIGPS